MTGAKRAEEIPAYLQLGKEQVYYVRHVALGKLRGKVVIAGAFASERVYAYSQIVRWARFLAQRGIEVVRFDYRGVGESTGRFEDMCCSMWLEDLEGVVNLVRRGAESTPLCLHGVRAGGLLAAASFEKGIGDALLLWGSPRNAQGHLRELLRRRLAEDMAVHAQGQRMTRDAYVRELESGRSVLVDGFRWEKTLWEDAARFVLEGNSRGSGGSLKGMLVRGRRRDGSTWKAEEWRAPIESPPFWSGRSPYLVPDLRELFEGSLKWIDGKGMDGGSVTA